MSIDRDGLLLGRLWMRWPYIEPRDLWIGAYVKPSYWEGGKRRQVVYLCPLPCLVFLFEWTHV